MPFEIKTRGYDPTAVTLVKLKNGAVIARSTTPVRDTMKPYVDRDDVPTDELLKADDKMIHELEKVTPPKQWPEDRIK